MHLLVEAQTDQGVVSGKNKEVLSKQEEYMPKQSEINVIPTNREESNKDTYSPQPLCCCGHRSSM